MLRTIAFERPTDRLLPRDSRQVVPFASKTRPHFDGLLLLIHAEDATDGMLTMDTASYSNSWSFEELRGADLVLREARATADELVRDARMTEQQLRRNIEAAQHQFSAYVASFRRLLDRHSAQIDALAEFEHDGRPPEAT